VSRKAWWRNVATAPMAPLSGRGGPAVEEQPAGDTRPRGRRLGRRSRKIAPSPRHANAHPAPVISPPACRTSPRFIRPRTTMGVDESEGTHFIEQRPSWRQRGAVEAGAVAPPGWGRSHVRRARAGSRVYRDRSAQARRGTKPPRRPAARAPALSSLALRLTLEAPLAARDSSLRYSMSGASGTDPEPMRAESPRGHVAKCARRTRRRHRSTRLRSRICSERDP
jgi:hypothetical protein